MLTGSKELALERAQETVSSDSRRELCQTNDVAIGRPTYIAKPSPLEKALRLEWLGQTAASICWIASVFVYGISSAGDWLQLAAASAWLLANIASLVQADD